MIIVIGAEHIVLEVISGLLSIYAIAAFSVRYHRHRHIISLTALVGILLAFVFYQISFWMLVFGFVLPPGSCDFETKDIFYITHLVIWYTFSIAHYAVSFCHGSFKGTFLEPILCELD